MAIEDKSDAAEVNAKFVSDDGFVVNSVEEAWSSYRTPMVTPASVVKINDAKVDNSSEVVATIVEVIHGMPNLGWFAELLKRLLWGRNNGTRETAVRSVKNRSAEIAIAEDRSEKIIDRLVNCLMDLQEGTLLIGVSIKDGHEQFVACMTALSVFCGAKPELLTRHLETIRVYLKEEDAKIQNLSVSMIDSILRVKRVSLSITSRLEEDLKYLVLNSPPSVVGPSVKCLATLSTTTRKAPVVLLKLLEDFVLTMRQHKHIKSLSRLSGKMIVLCSVHYLPPEKLLARQTWTISRNWNARRKYCKLERSQHHFMSCTSNSFVRQITINALLWLCKAWASCFLFGRVCFYGPNKMSC